MKIAAIQMVSTPDLQRNLEVAVRLVAQAGAHGAELVLLPEYFCLMGHKDSDKLAIQETPGQGPIQDCLARAALTHKLWLVGGTLPLASADPNRVHNSSLVFDPSGRCVARYDKIHLFRFDNGKEAYDESCTLVAGAQTVTFDLPSRDGHSYRVGLSVCYDLRFPELYRQLRADVLLVPSAFTFTTGQAHWELLLRARAIENLACVVAAAQGGRHENGRRTWGHSMIVGPWGEILAQADEGAAVIVTELLHEDLDRARARLPALDQAVLQTRN